MKVTYTGLGIMGSRMAANPPKHQADLPVFNRPEGPLKEIKDQPLHLANDQRIVCRSTKNGMSRLGLSATYRHLEKGI